MAAGRQAGWYGAGAVAESSRLETRQKEVTEWLDF